MTDWVRLDKLIFLPSHTSGFSDLRIDLYRATSFPNSRALRSSISIIGIQKLPFIIKSLKARKLKSLKVFTNIYVIILSYDDKKVKRFKTE